MDAETLASNLTAAREQWEETITDNVKMFLDDDLINWADDENFCDQTFVEENGELDADADEDAVAERDEALSNYRAGWEACRLAMKGQIEEFLEA